MSTPTALRGPCNWKMRLLSPLPTGPPVLLPSAGSPPKWEPRSQFWQWNASTTSVRVCVCVCIFMCACVHGMPSTFQTCTNHLSPSSKCASLPSSPTHRTQSVHMYGTLTQTCPVLPPQFLQLPSITSTSVWYLCACKSMLQFSSSLC